MEYISVIQFAEKYGISERTARNHRLCRYLSLVSRAIGILCPRVSRADFSLRFSPVDNPITRSVDFPENPKSAYSVIFLP